MARLFVFQGNNAGGPAPLIMDLTRRPNPAVILNYVSIYRTERMDTMDSITEPERQTPIVASVDLLVCGGGFAGFAAALSAAKLGSDVLLLEKYGFLGGLVTSALVITTPPLNNGINLEIADRLKQKNVYIPCKHSGPDTEWLEMRAVDPEIVKYEFVRMLQEKGVDMLLHTYIVGPIMERNVIRGVIMENKAGRQAVLAKMVVDATGDADIAAFASAPFREVKKPMTMMYNMFAHLEYWESPDTLYFILKRLRLDPPEV